MSYILDALKKAESERRLGSVPNLHAQPSVSAAPVRQFPRKTAVAAVIALAAALAWWMIPREPAAPPVAPLPPFPIADEPKAPEIVALGPLPAAQEAIAESFAPMQADPGQPAPRASKSRPNAAASAASDQEKPRKRTNQQSVPEAKVASAQALPSPAPGELPALSIGGYIYSDNPRERQLLVNKRLLHEGEEAAPGLVLEQMLPKAAVFNYRGKRYQVAY